MLPAVNDEPRVPMGVSTETLNEWLKLAHWTPEMLGRATFQSERSIKRQIIDGKIQGHRPSPNADPIIPIAEVRRVLGLD